MINGVHAVIFSKDAEGVRAFFRDVLGLPSVDAGGGWLIFALPPAELAAHPDGEESRHELYLMCDDIGTTVEELKAKGPTRALSPPTPASRAGTARPQAAGILAAHAHGTRGTPT